LENFLKPETFKKRGRSNEKKLITLLNRVSHLDGDAVKNLLTYDLDWDYIYHTSSLLGAAPLLYYHLKKMRTHRLEGSPLMDSFREGYHLTLANNLYLTHEFDTIAEKLSAAGIPCMGLKGITLARSLYPSPALRPMFDMDILTKPEDLLGVHETLGKLGYHASDKNPLNKDKNYQYHMHYMKETAVPVILELHWSLGEKNRYGLDESQIWKRAEGSLFGPQLEMSDDDTLLYLCLHFFKHFLFKRLSWLCDIYEWTARKEIHWDLVIERAQSQSIATFLAYTLIIFEKFYGTKLPLRTDDILKISPVRKTILDWYICKYDMFHPMETNNWFLKRLFAFTSIDRFPDKLKFTVDALKRDMG